MWEKNKKTNRSTPLSYILINCISVISIVCVLYVKSLFWAISCTEAEICLSQKLWGEKLNSAMCLNDFHKNLTDTHINLHVHHLVFLLSFFFNYIYRIYQKPLSLAYLKNAPKFWKTGNCVFNQFEGDRFWLKNFCIERAGEPTRSTTLKFQTLKIFHQNKNFD